MSNSKALKSGVWYTASNFLLKSIGFITTPIFARLLSKEDFGNYNNFMSWLSIMLIIVTLNVEASLISAKFDYKDNFNQYIFSVLALSSLSAMAWILLINIFSELSSNIFGFSPLYSNLMLVYIMLFPALNLFQTRERFLFEYKKTVLTSFLVSISTALLSVILVINLPDKFLGRTLGSTLPTILIGLTLYGYFICVGKKIDISCWKYALKVCLPYIPHLLSLTVLNSVDRIMINKTCGSEDTAMYSLAYSCGAIVTMLMTSMNSAFSPWLGVKLHEKDYYATRKVTKLYMSGFVALAFGIMLLTPEVLYIMGGEKYMDAKYVMLPVSMGCVCQFFYTMYVNVEQYEKKTLPMAFASASAALLNYILNSIFISKFGYIAAAYTTLAGFLWLLIIHMIIVKRIKLSIVYDNRFVIIIIGSSLVLSVGMLYLYSHNMLRYIVLAVYILVLLSITYKKRDTIIRFFKSKKEKKNG